MTNSLSFIIRHLCLKQESSLQQAFAESRKHLPLPKVIPVLHLEPVEASFWSMGMATSPPQLVIKSLEIVSSGLVINKSLKEKVARNHKD